MCTIEITALPGLLAHVVILKLGETKKYFGFLYGPEAEDSDVGKQLVTKLLKGCAQI